MRRDRQPPRVIGCRDGRGGTGRARRDRAGAGRPHRRAPRRDRRARVRADRLRHDEPVGGRRAGTRRGRAAAGAGRPARSAAGAEIDLWEPAPEDVADHPLSVAGHRASRAARSSRRRCAGAAAGARCCSTGTSTSCPPARGGLDGRPVRSAGRRTANIVGRGACDMKGGIAAMVVAAEALAAHRRPARRRDRVHEHRRGVQRRRRARVRAPRRAGRLRDRHRAELARGLARVPRHGLLHDHASRAAPGTPSRSTRTGATAAPSTRSRRAASCSTAWTGCAPSGARAPTSRHPLLDPPDIVPTRFVADAGWSVTIPDQRGDRPVGADPPPAGRRAAAGRRTPRPRSRRFLRRWCETDSWLAEHPPSVQLVHGGQPVRDAGGRGQRAGAAGGQRARSACPTRSAGSAPGTTARRSRWRPTRPR